MDDHGIESWRITGEPQALKDVALDFIDGRDRALEALNSRHAKVRVRATEILIRFAAAQRERWIAEAFSTRHPDVTILTEWRASPVADTSIRAEVRGGVVAGIFDLRL